MMHDATHTPARTEVTASRSSMPRRCATMAPVQAPVPGSGTPTKAATPTQRSCAPIALVFFCARFSTGARRLFTFGDRRAQRISGMGIMLPRMHSSITCGMPRPIQRPTGTPPRSSISGRAERTMRMAQLGSCRVVCRSSASLSPKCGLAGAAALEAMASAACPPSMPSPSDVASRSSARRHFSGPGMRLFHLCGNGGWPSDEIEGAIAAAATRGMERGS
mmetsp:Transcript_93168/g.259518  ORF Transcript_93168/g.259518 Transcript_93168/m.259518 type:complete len:220 (+) Transcript_93168:698-1357(+)